MSLEDEIRRELNMVALSQPAALEAMTAEYVDLDAMGVIVNMLLPITLAQNEALVRLAREIDALRGTSEGPGSQP